MPRKVCFVITARPSYSRVKSVLCAIKGNPLLELQLVVAGSALLDRYGSVVNFIEQDGFEVKARVYMVLEGENLTAMAKSTGLGLVELATVFDNLKPDLVVTIADRYETLATAIAASYMNIPLVHIQGGEVTGSIDEKVRHAVTKLSNVHFVSSSNARERVIRMGEDPCTVFVTGCPSIDIAAEIRDEPMLSFDLGKRCGGVGVQVDYSKKYIMVLQHPVTTEYDAACKNITETLRAVYDVGVPALWFWPNVDAGSDGTSRGIRIFREHFPDANIHFLKNVSPEDFLRLASHCQCIVGNSSVAIRECSFLGIPAVNIGTRQMGRERGSNVRDVNYSREEIVVAIQHHLQHGKVSGQSLYGDGRAGEKISELLSSISIQVEKKLPY